MTLMTLRWTDVGHSTANISTPAMEDAHTIDETFVGEFSNFYLSDVNYTNRDRLQ